MNYFFLSIIASVFVILGYIPEFYTIITCKKKDVGNVYIWLIWTTGNTFSIAYCVLCIDTGILYHGNQYHCFNYEFFYFYVKILLFAYL